MKNVFVSSTTLDLKDYRDAIDQVIRRLELHPVNMTDFGSQPGGPVEVSLREVRKSDVFIGILAYRYGEVPDGMHKSITEQEYDEAVKEHIPCLMYLVDPDYQWPNDFIEQSEKAQDQLRAFKNKVNRAEARSLFTTTDNLASKVAIDLSKLLRSLETNDTVRVAYLSEVLLQLSLVPHEWKNNYMSLYPGHFQNTEYSGGDVWDMLITVAAHEYSEIEWKKYLPLFDTVLSRIINRLEHLLAAHADVIPADIKIDVMKAVQQLRSEQKAYLLIPLIIEKFDDHSSFFHYRFTAVLQKLSELSRKLDKLRKSLQLKL